ncbi:two-component regulator propeller domain-containing protein [Mariniflexile gromovii]|uniref:LuxR family transcriptional regulator n=1 Tax=Mariniflexile gromovii TaxID=362523 RepID=A0ABS4BXU3_9FLAO|nr:two-component regulator propeller domain-containing protein [Mariniflexile gromovii]MBP0905406.1 LuxR family transcriptional regulator [Mariniflexile gromovii]
MKSIIHIGLCFLLLFFVPNSLLVQELPPIQKFTPTDYDGENQNWMISQAPNKFIYVANNEGLLEYNGAKWTMYPSPNNTIIRAVNVVGNRIYTGCYMEFGFWERDVFGKLQYQSLVSKFKETMIEDEHIWNIITYDEWVLFQSFNRIYFYNPVTGANSIMNSKNGISRVFNIQNVIYYHVTNEGIYKIVAGKPKLILDDQLFKNDKVVNIFSIEEGLLIQTRGAGFYTLINNKVSEWDAPAQQSIKKMNVFNSIQLKDKSFIIGTIKNGIVYLSKTGRIEYELNRSNGLSNNTALCVFEDRDENLWVGLDNGINCINIKSPIRVFNDDEGKIGTIYASAIFNGILYLGTNQGLFYKKAFSQEDPFKFVAGTSGQVWSLFQYNNELFCGHHSGTFIIKKDQAILVTSIPGTWGFKPIPNKENMLLEGNYNGLNVLAKENGNWKLKSKIEGFNNSARYFEITNHNEVWVSHGYKGVFRLKIDENFTKTKNVFIDSAVPIDKNSSLIKYKDRILYAYKDGVLAFDATKKSFVKDSTLSTIVTQSEYASGKLVVDDTQKLWAFSNDNISYVDVNDLTNELKINKVAIPYPLRKGQIGYENISHLKNNNYLIGITDGYLTLDISQLNKNESYQLILNSIELNTVETDNIAVDINSSGVFEYENNSITFNYSVPVYNKYNVVQYQYKLNGRYNQWSEWNSKSELIFENLPFGDYNLNIRAKIGNKLSSNVISYNFKINRPWFLSNTAILLYLVSIFGFSLFMHKTYKKYYKKLHAHKQLENEQLITSIKNEKLNQDIESKNRELAISTMSIIKKNEVLNSIKKELKKNKHTDNMAALKLIDNNLNDSKDWSFFEQAFNNADKDFLDKIKQSHPDLTPNDLRFCAYLRLNLSSKEMAPLLNISIKSVETKRYRLRKKLGLEHDSGLVNYILNF